jgi:hypothetical protein
MIKQNKKSEPIKEEEKQEVKEEEKKVASIRGGVSCNQYSIG